MKIQSELCHIERDRVIVKAVGYEGSVLIGTAMAEAVSVEEAEDKAISRLKERLNYDSSSNSNPYSSNENRNYNNVNKTSKPKDSISKLEGLPDISVVTTKDKNEISIIKDGQKDEISNPTDWSEELAEIDNQFKRIMWDRDKEGIYLKRAFGHRNRNMITSYSDIKKLKIQLEKLEPGSEPDKASIPKLRKDLIIESDLIIQRLKWGKEKAQSFLEDHMNQRSRQILSDMQLIEFNKLLSIELKKMNTN